jgi:hypothetical protein
MESAEKFRVSRLSKTTTILETTIAIDHATLELIITIMAAVAKKATVEKWASTHAHWLEFECDEKGSVTIISCKICKLMKRTKKNLWVTKLYL